MSLLATITGKHRHVVSSAAFIVLMERLLLQLIPELQTAVAPVEIGQGAAVCAAARLSSPSVTPRMLHNMVCNCKHTELSVVVRC